jgi:heme-degrading monooxygenase HmoA
MIRLTVADYERWKPVFDEYGAVRGKSGSQGGQLFRNADNAHEVLVLWKWTNQEQARAFFQSSGLRETMQQAGVTGRPEVVYLEAIEQLAV